MRVVAPDLLGYGGTDAPQAPPADIALYGFKKTSDDLAELARQLNAPKIILGGHDWGGMVVWRFAQWYPNLVTHIFTVCTPYAAPSDAYYPIEALVAGPAPQFGYQIQFASGELERHVRNKEDLDQVLKGFYGGAPPGKLFLSPQKGIDFSILGSCKKPALLDQDVCTAVLGTSPRLRRCRKWTLPSSSIAGTACMGLVSYCSHDGRYR